MNIKYKILLSLFLAVIILGSSYFLFFNKKDEGIKEKKQVEKKELIFSRINFFLSKENKASINIPNYWEGNYRMSETGNRVDFIYLKKGIESGNIFSIEMIKKSNHDLNNKEKVLFENEKYYYIFIKSTTVSNDNLYKSMNNDIQTLLKSFKVS